MVGKYIGGLFLDFMLHDDVKAHCVVIFSWYFINKLKYGMCPWDQREIICMGSIRLRTTLLKLWDGQGGIVVRPP